uniref:Uncharacterized protein n=1 Tax=viral metagenome TaxID=1070528 RepID=A0A6C0H9A9_9ZZZZ
MAVFFNFLRLVSLLYILFGSLLFQNYYYNIFYNNNYLELRLYNFNFYYNN